MSHINITSYFFHLRGIPETALMNSYLALAYQTATEKHIYPRQVFIRSKVHDTTWSESTRRYIKDPKGYHVTISYKTEDHMHSGTHITCHGYVWSRECMIFKEATFANEKPDTVLKKDGRFVWPSEEDLWRAPDIYTGHLVIEPSITNTGLELGQQGMRNESSSSGTSNVLRGLRNETLSSGASKDLHLQGIGNESSSSKTSKDITREL
ncbi:hypothetical protein E4U57_000871 [Claviceps arundinis]|uniref:Uncharacterized protein n=1 Tax=Claviceps arundinis TaxID=1623583 RepID=A0A9P7SRI8_9HYPO|nr:hypothetical protein E4U57_000871 [Claviceps arundinis]KAG5971182.1 hypothetical protein E4U56_007022 [Claviceps arundinis]